MEPNITETLLYENEFGKAFLKNEIVFMEFAPDIIIDLDVAKNMINNRRKNSNGMIKPIIVTMDNLKSITDDARDYFATEESMNDVKAVAVITNNRMHKMIVNFFIKFSKPQVPTMLFTKMEKAVEWVDKYK